MAAASEGAIEFFHGYTYSAHPLACAIADKVLELVGKPSSLKVHVDERLGQVDRHIGSTEKAEKLLGWRARTSFEDGLERTIAWYRDNEAWWRAPERRPADVFSS